MAWSEEIIEYKQIIMAKITHCPEIVEAIGNKEIEDLDDLIYNNIFPFKYIPIVQEETRTFILMSVDVPRVSTKNYFFKEVVVTLTVLCHQDLMRTEYGATRTDYIGKWLDRLFNGSTEFGNVPLELVSSVEGDASNTYRYRSMRFATQDMNRTGC